MRIDKFLWHVRLYKTRSIATDAVKSNQVSVNNQIVKPSKEISVGDTISIKKKQILYTIEVKQIPKNRLGAKLVFEYINDLTPPEELEKLKQINEVQSYYRQKGLGRPTKKDRRSIEDFIFDSDDEVTDSPIDE